MLYGKDLQRSRVIGDSSRVCVQSLSQSLDLRGKVEFRSRFWRWIATSGGSESRFGSKWSLMCIRVIDSTMFFHQVKRVLFAFSYISPSIHIDILILLYKKTGDRLDKVTELPFFLTVLFSFLLFFLSLSPSLEDVLS